MAPGYKICQACMDQNEVEHVPAAFLYGQRCEMCYTPNVLVYCCTEEWMQKLLYVEVHNQ